MWNFNILVRSPWMASCKPCEKPCHAGRSVNGDGALKQMLIEKTAKERRQLQGYTGVPWSKPNDFVEQAVPVCWFCFLISCKNGGANPASDCSQEPLGVAHNTAQRAYPRRHSPCFRIRRTQISSLLRLGWREPTGTSRRVEIETAWKWKVGMNACAGSVPATSAVSAAFTSEWVGLFRAGTGPHFLLRRRRSLPALRFPICWLSMLPVNLRAKNRPEKIFQDRSQTN